MDTKIKEQFELLGPPIDDSMDPLTLGMAIILLNRVCAEATAEEALDWIQKNYPAGTSNNWQLAREDHRKPVPCGENPKRTHFMFTC